jgi:hypothetical protein
MSENSRLRRQRHHERVVAQAAKGQTVDPRGGKSATPAPQKLRFAYLDTNFFHYVRRDHQLANRAVSYLRQQDLTVIISAFHLAELHKADYQHEVICRFWEDVGAVIVVPSGHTNYQSLELYPHVERAPPLICGPTCDEVVRPFLKGTPVEGSPTGYSAAVLHEALDKRKPLSRVIIDDIKTQFPDSIKRRQDFEDRWIFQNLFNNSATRFHPNFTRLDFPLVPGSFPSLRLQGALVWWTHIRIAPPKFEGSELGDRGHSAYFYCSDLIALEAFQHEMICQLRRVAPDLFTKDLQTFTTTGFVKFLKSAP